MLFHHGYLQHIGPEAAVQGHAGGIDDDVSRLYPAFLFQDIGNVLNGFIGGREAVVIVAPHPPDEI